MAWLINFVFILLITIVVMTCIVSIYIKMTTIRSSIIKLDKYCKTCKHSRLEKEKRLCDKSVINRPATVGSEMVCNKWKSKYPKGYRKG